MSDMQTTKDLDTSLMESALGTNARAAAVQSQKRTRILKWKKPAVDAMATDATTEELLGDIPFDGKVLNAWVKTNATETGHSTDHATFTIKSKLADASGSATVGTYTTDSDVTGQGTLTKWVRKAFALTDASVYVVAGGTLTIGITKGGGGIVLDALLEITVEIEDI